MNIKHFIYAFAAVGLLSCSKAEVAEDEIFAILKGTVTSDNGSPIEHLEVRVDLSKRMSPKTLYTSSDGKFQFDITGKEAKNIKNITITLTDIDEEANGGLFDTIVEEIHLYDEETQESPMILNLDFRCSRAIP
jgi:hypothetical protein